MTPPLREPCLALLRDWTRIPSVAGDPANLRRMARALAEYLQGRLGAVLTPGWEAGDAPVLHARIDRGAAVTLLLYNMYDVMPATEAGWAVPPFTGGVAELPGLGPCYVGRGAENNKGPLAGMLVALAALLDAGQLDANVEIVLDGQEESGSAALRQFLLAPDSPVRRCGAALFPSFCEYGGGPPRVYLGTKGIAHGRVRVASGDWGGPGSAIHSSNAPWIGNPVWALMEALAPLGTGTLGRVPLPEDMRPVLADLAAVFDPARELAFRHAARFAIPGDAAALLQAVLTTTSLNLSALATDPADGRAVIPREAAARFDLRTPPGVDPADILAGLPAAADWLLEDAYPGHRFAADHPAVRALVGSYRGMGAAPQIWPWAIGAMPAYAFAATAPCFLIGGLGHGGNAHGANEFVTVAGLDRFLAFMLAWLPATAAALTTAGATP